MHSFQSTLLVASLLVAAAVSTPTPTLNKRSFVHHVKRSVDKRSALAGPDEMARAYRKFGFQLISRQANVTAAAPGTGIVQAAPEPNDAEFLSPVNIGGQTVTLDFDTGSSDLYVLLWKLNTRKHGSNTSIDGSSALLFPSRPLVSTPHSTRPRASPSK
jgi:hypothetical protein